MRFRALQILIILLLIGPLVNGQLMPHVLGKKNAFIYDTEANRQDGTLVVNAVSEIQLWNIADETLLRSWPVSNILAIACRGDRIAGISKNGSTYVWSISGDQISQTEIAGASPNCITWLDSAAFVVGLNDGGLVKMSGSGKELLRVKSESGISALTATNDGAFIAGDVNGKLSTYNAGDFSLKSRTIAHKRWIRGVRTSFNKSLITVADDGFLKIWNHSLPRGITAKKHRGTWVTCLDLYSNADAKNDVYVLGQLNGTVILVTAVGTIYKYKLPFMVTSVAVIESSLHTNRLAVGTYGGGLWVIDGRKMNIAN